MKLLQENFLSSHYFCSSENFDMCSACVYDENEKKRMEKEKCKLEKLSYVMSF